jgi:hypothetical protein
MRPFTLASAVLTAVFGLAGFSSEARSWGHDGHRIVAAIAFKLLPPEKAAALDKLLKESEVGRGFVEAAGYPDDVIRGQDHSFNPWHYVNWPDDQLKTSAQSCPHSCIIKALRDQINVAKTSQDPEEKALALSWVIHLVGDLHQPLHVADRDGDEGGNGFGVSYKGKNTCGPPSFPRAIKKVQLHKVWDDCLVISLEAGKTWQQTADDIRGNLTTYKGQAAAKGNIQDWAKEAHILAHTRAYANLRDGDDLEDEYIDSALPVVKDQLLKAGIRLAKVIDDNM